MAKKYALIIGIENYPKASGQSKVAYGKNDARAMADYARQAGFRLINGKPLLDEDASYSNVIEHIDYLFDHAKPEDFILIYYAGHGSFSEYGGYLIPFDYQETRKINETCCISFDSIEKRFKSKKNKRFIFLLDTCHSGFARKQLDIRSAAPRHIILSSQTQEKVKSQYKEMLDTNETSQDVGRVIFTSSGPNEKSHSIKEFEHGLFTYYFLIALKAEDGKKKVNIEKLISSVKENVRDYCFNNKYKQTPNAYCNIPGQFFIPAYEFKLNTVGTSPGGTRAPSNISKKRIITILSILLLIAAIFVTAQMVITAQMRENDKQAYEKASTIGDYKDYIKNFPGGKYVLDAKVRIKELEAEREAYENASSLDTIEAYEKYIREFPGGVILPKAKERLAELKSMPYEVYTAHLSPKINVSKNPKGYWEAEHKKFDITMIFIPAGNFKMGQIEKEKEWLIKKVGDKDYNQYYKNETPVHEVFLGDYWMGKTELTNEQYVTFLNDSGINHKSGCQGKQCIDTKKESRYSHITGSKGNYSVEPGYENHPVTDVSWYGAVEYCMWLSQKTGLNFKLPTEAKWEKSSRWLISEKRNFMFPWGDQDQDATLAHFSSGETSPVDSYIKGMSPYGLLNMAGNAWEWCLDWYNPNYYAKSFKENPKGPKTGKYKVRRGGGWNNPAISLRCAGRSEYLPSKRYSNVGFRLCQN